MENTTTENKKTETKKVKKVFNIILTVLVYIFVAIGFLSVVLTVTAKKSSDGTSEIFGYQMRVVLSPSMEKCEFTDVSKYKIKDIPVGSMVFVEAIPDDDVKAEKWLSKLKVGDVLTFRYLYTTQETITHRITLIEETENGYTIHLQGDNKNSEDGVLEQIINTAERDVSPNYIMGKVVGQSKALGWVVNLLTEHKLAVLFILIVPCAIIIIFEIMKIVDAFHSEKAEKKKAEDTAKKNELEELKKQLAALQQQMKQPETESGTEEKTKEVTEEKTESGTKEETTPPVMEEKTETSHNENADNGASNSEPSKPEAESGTKEETANSEN